MSVPVLSSNASSTSAAASKTSPPLTITPEDEAEDNAAAWGIGDASRREQGHDTTQSNRVVKKPCSDHP